MQIDLSSLEFKDVVKSSLEELVAGNEPPRLFQRDQKLLRLYGEGEAVRAAEHGEASLGLEMSRAADYGRWSRGNNPTWSPSAPPRDAVRMLLASGEYDGVPILDRVVSAPVLDSRGRQLKDGYNPESRTYLARDPALKGAGGGLDVEVSLQRLDSLLYDFRLTEQGRATAIAMMLTPLVREMISGPTPMFVLNAPREGAGKTLLTQCALYPVCGAVEATHAPNREDEMQKLVAALLRTSPSAVLLDNLASASERLDAPSLARALTANPTYQDRLLGRNQLVRVTVKNTWVVTGNNVGLSGELERRSTWINLQEPAASGKFRHADLVGWTHSHRAQLFAALVSLVDHWIDDEDGKPTPGPSLPSFESWSLVVGSILRAAGVRGFGEPWREQLNEEGAVLSAEDDELAGLLDAWTRSIGATPVTTQQVIMMAVAHPELAAALPTTKNAYALGQHLMKWKGRTVGGRRLVRAGRTWKMV